MEPLQFQCQWALITGGPQREDRRSRAHGTSIRIREAWRQHDAVHPVLEKLPYIVVLVDEFADLMIGKKRWKS